MNFINFHQILQTCLKVANNILAFDFNPFLLFNFKKVRFKLFTKLKVRKLIIKTSYLFLKISKIEFI